MNSGCNALSALRALPENERPEVVITDWHMPQMSGSEFLSWMVEQFPKIPRIVVTGDTEPPDLDDVLRTVEVYDVLFKPVSAETIRERVKEAILHVSNRNNSGATNAGDTAERGVAVVD